jgi:hypothetical protein
VTKHDIVWGVIVGVLVFGGYLEWFLDKLARRESDRDV